MTARRAAAVQRERGVDSPRFLFVAPTRTAAAGTRRAATPAGVDLPVPRGPVQLRAFSRRHRRSTAPGTDGLITSWDSYLEKIE
jgi:hypothetical protein